jgi:predicted DCC family thiol-disulfide oxidoreductase YuxK
MTKLTIFYDGFCPLCVKEMEKLKQFDQNDDIQLIDIHTSAFTPYTNIDADKASRILHAIDDKNQLLLGLDVTYRAWSLVGKGWIYAPLRWPIIKPIADRAYLHFANNRYRWSKILTGKSRCDSNSCR